MTTACIIQPSYLPWLGYFDQIARSDVFVFYDDVAFDKHGWRNRNRVKTATGLQWLTVPVLHKGRGGQRIDEVRIDDRTDWATKHLRAIGQSYAAAPFRSEVLDLLEGLLRRPWTLLADLDIAVVEGICAWLGLERRMVRASALGTGGGQSERLVRICRHFGANCYLTGDKAQNYLDEDQFSAPGIRVVWQSYEHPVYPQLHGPFVSHLSIVDALMNIGRNTIELLAGPQVPRDAAL